MMKPGAVDRTRYGRLVRLRIDGFGRRENAVVNCTGCSNQTDSFALGLWDELDDFAHVSLLLLRAALRRRLGWQVGRSARVNRWGNRKEPFRIVEKPGDRVASQPG